MSSSCGQGLHEAEALVAKTGFEADIDVCLIENPLCAPYRKQIALVNR